MRKTVNSQRSAAFGSAPTPAYPIFWASGAGIWTSAPRTSSNCTLYQLGAMSAMCKVAGVDMQHVKAHGALSDMAAQHRSIAEAIVEAVVLFDSALVVYTTWNSQVHEVARGRGLRVALEVYVDRCVDDAGVEIPGYSIHTRRFGRRCDPAGRVRPADRTPEDEYRSDYSMVSEQYLLPRRHPRHPPFRHETARPTGSGRLQCSCPSRLDAFGRRRSTLSRSSGKGSTCRQCSG